MATLFPQTQQPLAPTSNLFQSTFENSLAARQMQDQNALQKQQQARQKTLDRINIYKTAVGTGNKAQADAIWKSAYSEEELPDWSFEGDQFKTTINVQGKQLTVEGPRDKVTKFFEGRAENPEYFEDPKNGPQIQAWFAQNGISFSEGPPAKQGEISVEQLIQKRDAHPQGSDAYNFYDRKIKGQKPGEKQDKSFDREKKLRGEFEKSSSEYKKIRDSFGRVQESKSDPSPAGDLALIFNYMKMLDPGSVVRESEFATAAASGSLGERFKAAGLKILEGEKLSAKMRKDFVDRAEKFYKREDERHGKREKRYNKLAKDYGLSESAVVQDLRDPERLPEEVGQETMPTEIKFLGFE